MKRILVGLTDEQHVRLKAEAKRQIRSVGSLIREAVDDAFPPAMHERRRAHEAAKQIFGRYSSGRADISERHDDYLLELPRW